VFEQFLLGEESRKICRKLLMYTNHVPDLMLLVYVHDTSHVKHVSNEIEPARSLPGRGITLGVESRARTITCHRMFGRPTPRHGLPWEGLGSFTTNISTVTRNKKW
jgi:hypothetical protein